MERPWRTTPIVNSRWRWLRPAGYALILLLLIAPLIQFQRGTMKYLERARVAERTAALTPQEAAEAGKDHKGAIGRWRSDIRHFWQGENIYLGVVPEGVYIPPLDHAPGEGWAVKHPNMPFVVLLLSPFAYLPVPVMALLFNLVKVAAVLATVGMAVRVVNHRDDRMPDWVAFLGTLAAIDFFIGDLQHGNTNTFVAASVVGHLYFYRRGNDGLAGVLLALGICLKLTPALFLVYWLWQRQWKVLAATAVALPSMMLLPALFTGWEFFAWCMATWWEGLIGPALAGQWYPNHINQSLSAMVGRLFSGGDAGNYQWDPDTAPVPFRFGWITVVDLGPEGAKVVLRVLQAAMLGAFLWAVGWRVRPRDDGRRGLHYGMIAAMMLLLNQRSWDHHAAYLIIAHMAVAYAAAASTLPRRARVILGWVQAASVLWLHLMSDDLLESALGEAGAQRMLAWGSSFWHFLVVWGLCIVLSVMLRRREPAYVLSPEREPVR